MLSNEQFEQFDKKGYLLISGLLSKDIIDNAEKAMWQQMGMDPDEPATWKHFKRPHLAGF